MCQRTLVIPAGVYYPAPLRQESNWPLPESGHPGFLNSWGEREMGGEAQWSKSKGGGGWLGVTDAWLPREIRSWGQGPLHPPLYPPLMRESGEDRSLLRAWWGWGESGLGTRGSEGLWEPPLLEPEAILIFRCSRKVISAIHPGDAHTGAQPVGVRTLIHSSGLRIHSPQTTADVLAPSSVGCRLLRGSQGQKSDHLRT